MTTFLSSVRLSKAGAFIVNDGKLCPIPAKCRNCQLYLNASCAKDAGFSQCKYGYSVFKDQPQDCLFFGMRVIGLYDKKRVTRQKIQVCLTQQQVLELASYDLIKARGVNINDLIEAFSESYDACVSQLKDELPRWNDEQSLVMVSSDQINLVRQLVERLGELRSETEKLLNAHVPFVLFPSIGSSCASVFLPEQICAVCKDHECEKMDTSQELRFTTCRHGCSLCSYQHNMFYGIRVDGHYVKHLCRSSESVKKIPTFSEPLVKELVVLTVSQNDWIFTVGKFLHDIGQYVFGIANLLPVVRSGTSVMTFATADLKSIKAFVSALKSLKRAFFSEIRGEAYRERRIFEPFPLIYKYRLCFQCGDVDISVIDNDKESRLGRHEMVEGPAGFEFIVLNIFSNAVKYLPLSPENRKIKVLLEKNDRGLQILVSSLGLHLGREEMRHLGERGFRGFLARKNNKRGKGLGLSSIVAYIKAAGYEISFDSGDEVQNIGGGEYSMFSVCIKIPHQFCRGKKVEG